MTERDIGKPDVIEFCYECGGGGKLPPDTIGANMKECFICHGEGWRLSQEFLTILQKALGLDLPIDA